MALFLVYYNDENGLIRQAEGEYKNLQDFRTMCDLYGLPYKKFKNIKLIKKK